MKHSKKQFCMDKENIKQALETKNRVEYEFYNEFSLQEIIADIAAMANTGGGKIIIGVNSETDEIKGIDIPKTGEYTKTLEKEVSQLIKPYVDMEILVVKIGKNKQVLVVDVAEGANKPYCTNDSVFRMRIKTGNKHLKVHKNFRKLFQSQNNLPADVRPVTQASRENIDVQRFNRFFLDYYQEKPENVNIPVAKLMSNLNLMKDKKYTMAALLFFGKNNRKLLPDYAVEVSYYYGNKAVDGECVEFHTIAGTLPHQLSKTTDKIVKYLDKHFIKKTKTYIEEIPVPAIQELISNALIHRDYTSKRPIKVAIFKNRLEIENPGCLPPFLNIENIKFGTVYFRNPVIHSFAIKIMQHKGAGIGITKALNAYPQIIFINDENKNRFKTIIYRPQY